LVSAVQSRQAALVSTHDEPETEEEAEQERADGDVHLPEPGGVSLSDALHPPEGALDRADDRLELLVVGLVQGRADPAARSPRRRFRVRARMSAIRVCRTDSSDERPSSVTPLIVCPPTVPPPRRARTRPVATVSLARIWRSTSIVLSPLTLSSSQMCDSVT
jgi:hypothetical protein